VERDVTMITIDGATPSWIDIRLATPFENKVFDGHMEEGHNDRWTLHGRDQDGKEVFYIIGRRKTWAKALHDAIEWVNKNVLEWER
jgi:hypothetical protein